MKMINRAIFRRTLSDFLRIRTLAGYLAFLAVPLVLFAAIAQSVPFFSVTSLDLKVEYTFGFFSLFSYVWVSGLALAFLAAFFCSSLIAGEVSDRTLLLLVTKPVRRFEIFMSKFLAFMLAMVVYALLSLLVAIYVWASYFQLDVSALAMFASRAPLFFVYSVFVALFFGSLSAAISAVSSSRLKAVIPALLVVLLSFLVFIQVRGAARSMGSYEGLLSTLDVGYDFGNIYVTTLEAGGVRFIPYMQAILGTFTGVYDVPQEMVAVDYDHGFILPSLDRLEYRSPLHSVAKLTLTPLLLVALGLFLFSRRDIG
jgi:ABC-type transport system involved in multi-copper enzyme maturation permease subunit